MGERRGETRESSRRRPTPVGATPMRARVWLPEVGVFSAIDELAYHDARSTLWGWPGQSPVRWRDPYGRGVVPRGPDFLRLLGDAAFDNAADLRDFAVADYQAGNYTSAYFHGGLAFDMALIGVAAKALPAIVDAVAMAEGGGRSCKLGNSPRAGGARGTGARPANNGVSPPHGSPAHDARVRKIASSMKKNKWEDVRVNQQQVDAKGNVVGRNRPDVQGTHPETGQRVNIEIDTSESGSLRHQRVVPANDPDAVNTFIGIDGEGRPTSATTRRP